ncbi:hypothetical protein OTU49_002584 [Cherax quadricarinatus]|uniref:Uncharacterized protein n=1 Tax=Cherax quadricarinatus TaxID=27406 RepID=A0AAW0XA69_CHEQU
MFSGAQMMVYVMENNVRRGQCLFSASWLLWRCSREKNAVETMSSFNIIIYQVYHHMIFTKHSAEFNPMQLRPLFKLHGPTSNWCKSIFQDFSEVQTSTICCHMLESSKVCSAANIITFHADYIP